MKLLAPGELASFQAQIKENVGAPRYDLWFHGNTTITLEHDALEIGVPNRFFREWLESHFQEEIKTASLKVFGKVLPIRFRIDAGLFQQTRGDLQGSATLTPPAPRVVKPQARLSRYSLARFVQGAPNRVAYAAASAMIEDPRRSYGPLLIYGSVGHGKTHLLNAIAEGVRQRHADLKMIALSCEEFTNQFLEAMKSGTLNAFRRKFRQLDLLLIDDIQFLSNKRATQEEFLHTANALEARGGKLVLTADVHPRRMTKMSEELKSRFVSGMVAKLDPPTREMRRQILLNKAAQRHLTVPQPVADFLAENLRSSVCELEGALNYLEHYCETYDAEVTLATAKSALAEILRHSVPVVRIKEVVTKACELFGLNPRQLRDRSRRRAVSHPRMLILYLARKYTQATYHEIGQEVAGLNHSTVMAAEKKVQALIAADGEIALGSRTWKARDAIEAFEREIGRG